MIFIPSSLIDHKINLGTICCLAQIFVLILCALVHSNQAAVIKRRNTTFIGTESGNLGLDKAKTNVMPTNLISLHNASDIVTARVQSMVVPSFALETSKELINNEVLINKKQFEEGNDIKRLKNETILKAKSENENLENKLKNLEELENSLQGVKQIIENLKNKEEQGLKEIPQTTTKIKGDNIKKDKIEKLMGKLFANSSQYDSNQYANASSSENILKIVDKNQIDPSRILTELRTETEKPLIKTKVANVVESSKEHSIKSDLNIDNKEKSLISLEVVTNKSLEQPDLKGTTSSPIALINEKKVLQPINIESLANTSEIITREPQIANVVETNKEHAIKSELKVENKEKPLISLEVATNKSLGQPDLKSTTSSLMALINEKKVLQPKIFESLANTSEIIEREPQIKSSETFTSVPKATENLQVLKASTKMPSEDLGSGNKIKFLESETKLENDLSQKNRSKKIQYGLDHKDVLISIKEQPTILTNSDSPLILNGTTLKPMTKEEGLLIYESDKKEYARSLFIKETTTMNIRDVNELITPVTTFRPVILSTKKDIEETNHENFKDLVKDLKKTNLTTLNVKEKKPKYISDNSTNAQQLNIPNNAEVWSLAAMKSLPKPNVTIETAQTHNKTNKEFEEKVSYNTSFSLNNNSEKNLLDWSHIMMDKELSTTTRSKNWRQEEDEAENSENNLKTEERQTEAERKDLESVINISTLTPEVKGAQLKLQTGEIMITKNSLIEHELATSTVSSVSTSTILSSLNYNENDNDNNNNNLAKKKVEDNMNNHIDVLTATIATTVASNMNNNPLNTSLNIKTNLNEINLTSDQTKVDLSKDVYTITTSENKRIGVDVDINSNTNAYIETSTVAAAATTTTMMMDTTTTKATAVIDMTTVEQISIETTTVSTLEATRQRTSLNDVLINKQQIKNKLINEIYEKSNSSSSILHDELENVVVDKQSYQNEINNLNEKTTTVVPITTLRPTILAITSTTSIPVTFEQEIDQNSNEIQTNKPNTNQQSIIKADLHYNHSTKAIETHITEREFETTTLETLTTTTPSTPTTELTAVKIANTNTSSLQNETTITTSLSKDEIVDETTELSLYSSETTTTTQTTLKQVDENRNSEEVKTTTGSSVSTDEKFNKENNTNTITEANFTLNTSTITPVVADTEGSKELNEIKAPTTTTTTTSSQNIITATTAKPENTLSLEDAKIESTTKVMNNTQEISTTTTSMPATVSKEEETYISLLDDTGTTTDTYPSIVSTIATSQTQVKTTTTISPPLLSSTLPSVITTKVEEIYSVINSTTTELIQTTTQQLLTEIKKESSSTSTSAYTEMFTPTTSTHSNQVIGSADIGKSIPTLTTIMGGSSGNIYPKNAGTSMETDVNVIIAITVSIIGVIALILLVGFLYLMRKRQKQTSYSQRCRPVSLDEYTIDNASVGGSMRKSSALRASKRTYGNLAFDDPSLRPNPMGVQELTKFAQEKLRIFEEFRDVPQITSRLDEVPIGCEDKNRYANVLPLPETRVILQRLNDDEKSEYINANYVTGPKDAPNYYIACQAPLESTVEDFWRMIWEQQSRVIIQATDLIENGVEKCAEYLPPSVTLDNHCSYGDFQITLQNREIKDKYAISTILLKHVVENSTRELTHYWYKWPEMGVPNEEAPIIAMLLEARSSLISYAIEQANGDKEKSIKSIEEKTVTANDFTTLPTNNTNGNNADGGTGEINGNISMVHTKKAARNQGPLTIHCSPGTGRTGTIIACDIAIRSLETPKRTVDIPQIVYYVRRGRASAILTKEQYEFIYKVANMYAAKITNPTNYN